jgi:hypothetical protein
MKVQELIENTIAYYDEKHRQRVAKTLTAQKLVKKINASTMPQEIANKVATAAKSFDGELTKDDVKKICKAAKLSAADTEEVMDLIS